MKNRFADKKTGFYLTLVAVVLALAALIPYGQTAYVLSYVKWIVVAAAAFEVLTVLLSFTGKKELANGCQTLVTVTLAAAIIISVTNQIYPIAYVISGLYNFEQIQGFVIYEGMILVSWLLCIVASFVGVVKTEN